MMTSLVNGSLTDDRADHRSVTTTNRRQLTKQQVEGTTKLVDT